MNTSFISTNQIKDLVIEQKFTSTRVIMECMKSMFADVLIQALQVKIDLHLGYDRAERTSCVDGIEERILSLYAIEMFTRDIKDQIYKYRNFRMTRNQD